MRFHAIIERRVVLALWFLHDVERASVLASWALCGCVGGAGDIYVSLKNMNDVQNTHFWGRAARRAAPSREMVRVALFHSLAALAAAQSTHAPGCEDDPSYFDVWSCQCAARRSPPTNLASK